MCRIQRIASLLQNESFHAKLSNCQMLKRFQVEAKRQQNVSDREYNHKVADMPQKIESAGSQRDGADGSGRDD